jgi:hypothetical protein
MGLFLLDAIFQLFEIRGHIPGNDGLPERPERPSICGNSGRRRRIVAVAIGIAAVVSLVLWAAVWLAIKSR